MTTNNIINLKDILPVPFNDSSRIMFINSISGEIFVSTTESFTNTILANTAVLSSTIYKVNNKTPDNNNSITLVANDVGAYTKAEVNSTFLKTNFSNLQGNIDASGYSIINLDLADPTNDGDVVSKFYLDKRITELLEGEIITINNKTPDSNGNVEITAFDVGVYSKIESDALFRTKVDSYSKIDLNNNTITSISDPQNASNIANKKYVDDKLETKANVEHSHLIGDLKYNNNTSLEIWLGLTYATTTSLNTGLNSKANITDLIKPALVSIPVLATTIVNGAIVNLNLGTPVLSVGDGVIGDYVSVAGNIIKTKTGKRIVNFSSSILGNYSAPNGNRSYRMLIRRPSVVSVAGTNANDILNENTDAKLGTSLIADSEFTFASTFTGGAIDPFNIDGFVASIDNISGLNITTITTRTGYAKASYIRIEFK